MRILAFIEDEEVVKKVLKHLGLWEIKDRPPPKATGKAQEYHLDNSTSQLPASDKRFYVHPGRIVIMQQRLRVMSI